VVFWRYVYQVVSLPVGAEELQIFHLTTLDLSKASVPTISKILLLYKLVEEHLKCCKDDLQLEDNSYGLDITIEASLEKLSVYMEKTLVSEYPLLGASMLQYMCTCL
jgi:hypothetical protein